MATQLKERKQAVVNNGYRSKYSFTHFLEWNMGRRYTLGIFENVTQASWRKNGDYRGVDWEYLNPFVIFRPGEFNAGSPDKMIVGLTSKFICTDWLTLYGQIMFNEFRLKELTAGTGYWSNKYAFQIGAKTFNIFRCDGLDFQAEYNQARPFCYSQYDALGCYTHLNQSMAHPSEPISKRGSLSSTTITGERKHERKSILRNMATISPAILSPTVTTRLSPPTPAMRNMASTRFKV